MAANYSLGVATGVIRIVYDDAGVTKAQGGIKATEAQSTKSAGVMGKNAKILAAGGLIIAAGLAVATKQAADFQAKMELLVTAGGESQAALGSVSKGIEKIAIDTGTGLDDLAEGMYIVEKAGYRGAAGLNVLRVAAQGARAEGVQLSIMTQGLTSIMQSYAGTMKNPVQATNELVAAAGMAKTTMTDFVNSLPTVLPIASAAGISFAQVAGALATLTQHGTSAAEAAVEVANTIRNLQAPSQVASKAMQQIGINVVDLETNLGKRGLTGTLDLVVNAIKTKMGPAGTVAVDAFMKSRTAGEDLQTMLAKMPADLKKLSQGLLDGSVDAKTYRSSVKAMDIQGAAMGGQFLNLATQANGFNALLKSGSPQAQTFAGYLKQVMGGATGLNTALQLSGESTAYFNNAVETVNKSASESGKDISTWAKTQQNASVQMGRLKASGEVLGVTLGTVLLPAVVAIAKGLGGMLAWVAGLSSGWQKMIVGVLGVVAALLLLASTFKKLEEAAKALKALALLLKLNVLWTNIAAAATKAWAVVQGILDAELWGNPIGLVVLAIVALVAAIILVIKYHKQIAQFFVMVWGGIWSFMKMVGAWFAGPFVDFFKGVWKSIQAPFLAIWNFLKTIGAWFAGPFANFFIAGWDGVMAAFDAVKSFIMKFVAAVVTIFEDAWKAISKILNFFAPLFKAIFGLIVAIITLEMKLAWMVISFALMVIIKVVKIWFALFMTVWTAVWGFVKNLVMTVWDWITNKIAQALTAIRVAISVVMGLITAAWNAAWNAVRMVVQAVWGFIGPYVMGAVHGIEKGLSAAWNAIKTAAVAVWNAIMGVLRGVWSRISSALSAVGKVGAKIGGYFQQAYDAIKTKVSAAVSYVAGLGAKIIKAIGNTGSMLYSAGKNIIQGLINGITNMIGKLTSKLKSITKMIPSFKGPIEVDAKLLTPNGQTIMKGLIDGIDKMTPDLEKTLRAVTNSIPFNVHTAAKQTSTFTQTMQQSVSQAAGRKKDMGPYQMIVNGKVLSEFVIDTVTGQPKAVANVASEGSRQRSWAGSGRSN